MFKLSKLHSSFHSLLSHFCDAQKQQDGKHINVFKEAMHSLLKDALNNFDISDDS